jgi:O-antigen/teichoic acid export membrane protein
MLRRFAAHTSNYTISSVLVTLAGLVSFPILTRVLDVGEYGVMNLIATALSLMVGIAKLGMQHSTLRFYSEIKAGKQGITLDGYVSTVMLGMGAVGFLVTLLWAIISQFVPQSWWNDDRVKIFMLVTSSLILIRVVDSALVNQLRAQERSGVLMVFNVLRRYFALVVLLGTLFYIAGNLWGFFLATIVGELVPVLILGIWMLRGQVPRFNMFSVKLFKEMLVFGIPMVGYELSTVILSMGDRYLIQNILGAEMLGIYSAAYNLCDYLKAILLASLVAAAQPMYMRLWAEKGPTETIEFLRRFMHIYLLAAALVIAGVASIGQELLVILASEKYRGGATIIPFVMTGMALHAVVVIIGAGLYIDKRSKTVLVLIVGAAVLNVALNLLLLPRLGLLGAALANLLSFAFLLLGCAIAGRGTLPVPVPIGQLLKTSTFGVAMYLSVKQIHTESEFLTLTLRVAIGCALFATLALCFDREVRSWIAPIRRKILGR